MKTHTLALTMRPVLAAIILGACSTTPDMPKNAWKITPVQTVRHGGATADGYFALGRVKEGQGASIQAIEAYRKAIAADPAHAAAWNALGALQMQLGHTDEGLQALERAVSLAPATSHLHNNLGYALLLAGRDDDAAKALRRAVELDGSNRRAWSNLATAYRRLGALDQAEFADARASDRWSAPLPTPTIAVSTSRQLPSLPPSQPAANAPAPMPHRPAPTISVSVAPAPAPALAAPAVVIGAVVSETSLTATPIAALTPAQSHAPAEGHPAAGIEVQTAASGFAALSQTSIRTTAAPMVFESPRATLVKVAENVFELRNAPTDSGAIAISEAAAIITAVAPATPAAVQPPVAATTTPSIAQAPAIGAATPPARYEISNGHGAEGLARRLAALLGQQGFARPRLTNQRPFNEPESVIQYREGYRASAEAFASQLPFRPTVLAAASGDLRADVRLVLGRDLTTCDACAVLGLCARVARTAPPKVVAARSVAAAPD